MRKSKTASVLSHLGGVDPAIGIIPPAAKRFDKALRPENDPILREVLSPEELAHLTEVRAASQSLSTRLHPHDQQVRNDNIRQQHVNAILRNNLDRHPSALERRKTALRDAETEAYSLSRAAPLSVEEEGRLLGKAVDDPGVVPVETPWTDERIVPAEDSADNRPETVKKKAIGPVPADEVVKAPVTGGRKKGKRKSLSPVKAEDAAGVGGTPFISNPVGKNLRAALPVKPRS